MPAVLEEAYQKSRKTVKFDSPIPHLSEGGSTITKIHIGLASWPIRPLNIRHSYSATWLLAMPCTEADSSLKMGFINSELLENGWG